MTDSASLESIHEWAKSSKLIDLVDNNDNSRVIHGDLKADQVFVFSDGYQVIDRQRPIEEFVVPRSMPTG